MVMLLITGLVFVLFDRTGCGAICDANLLYSSLVLLSLLFTSATFYFFSAHMPDYRFMYILSLFFHLFPGNLVGYIVLPGNLEHVNNSI